MIQVGDISGSEPSDSTVVLLVRSPIHQGPECTHRNRTSEGKAEWINFNSFAARLLNHDMVSWFTLTVWSLRDALEKNPRECLLDCNVAAAAQWIIHSGEVLFSFLEDDEAESETDRYWTGPLWKGKDTLSVSRWKFWKQRFSEISDKETGQAGSAAEMAR